MTRAAAIEPLLMDALPRAYQVALRLTGDPVDAEDVVQDAVVCALRGFDTFEPGSNFRAWFLKVLTNAFLMRCRKASVRRETTALDAESELVLYRRFAEVDSGWNGDAAHAFFSALDTRTVLRAIAELPVHYRLVASLYFVDDMAYADIASILELPVGTIRSRLHRARSLLQQALWEVAVELGVVRSAGG